MTEKNPEIVKEVEFINIVITAMAKYVESLKTDLGSIKAGMASFKDEMKAELKAEMCSIKDEVKTEIKADMGLTLATKAELTSAIASAKSEILNAISLLYFL